MTRYEYRVVPAPSRGAKVKGAKTTEARFAHVLSELMNEMGRDGWEYQRSDTLPCEERVGLTGRTTRFQNMLVFRREIPARADASAAPPAVEALEALPAPVEAPLLEAGPVEVPRLDPAPVEDRRQEGSRYSLVAQKLADTLSARPRSAPVLRAVPNSGAAPKLGGVTGNGATRPPEG